MHTRTRRQVSYHRATASPSSPPLHPSSGDAARGEGTAEERGRPVVRAERAPCFPRSHTDVHARLPHSLSRCCVAGRQHVGEAEEERRARGSLLFSPALPSCAARRNDDLRRRCAGRCTAQGKLPNLDWKWNNLTSLLLLLLLVALPPPPPLPPPVYFLPVQHSCLT